MVVWQMSALGEARQLSLAGKQAPLMRNGNTQLNAMMKHEGATATILLKNVYFLYISKPRQAPGQGEALRHRSNPNKATDDT